MARRTHDWPVCACMTLFIAVILGALAGISYGIAYGVEKALTGEGFGAPGHESLFRICETSSTSSNPFRAHTCNVFAPGSDTNAPPKKAFTELNKHWYRRRRYNGVTGAWPLEELLHLADLACQVTDPIVASRYSKAQIIIGDVGQSFFRRKHAYACNYRSDGSNMQRHCGRYGGGTLAGATPHPLSINQIFEKHFGRGNCSFISR